MKCKRKTKLEMAQDKAQAAINKTNETIEELGNHTSNLYDSLTSIQDSFDRIRNVPNDKKLQYEELKKIRLNWRLQAEKIEKDYQVAAVKNAGAGAAGASLGVAVVTMGPTVAMGVARKKKYKKLSKGEKLKFAFAFALAHHPKLLLLDEPGANFDQTFREEFHHILREFTADGTKSVILSTHITSDVDRFADYLLLLKKGRQLLYGDIESVRDAYRMVAGERHALRAFGGRLVYMEETPVGCSALVKHDHAEYDRALKVWEPDTEELMYYLAKGAEHGRGNQI